MRSQYPGEKGYNPGSQLIQIAGISCLDETDHWFKENKRCRFYIRYIVFEKNQKRLEDIINEFETKLKDIGFEFNHKKTRIYHQTNGIRFLGFRFFISETGKIVQLANSDTLKRDYKHWKNIEKSIINRKYELLTMQKLEESIESTLNYIKKAKSFKLRNKISKIKKNMVNYIKSEVKNNGQGKSKRKNTWRNCRRGEY